MAENNTAVGGNIGFFGVLFVIFLILKLTGYINWSWWIICLPLYGPLLLVSGGVLVFLLGLFLYFLIEEWGKKKKRK